MARTDLDSPAAVLKSSAAQLSQIMDLETAGQEVWDEQDLPAMLRHQFSAPLEFDLNSMKLPAREAQRRDRTLTGAATDRMRSFEDLLFHQAPPLELLQLAKEFFKWRTQAAKRGSPAWKIAYLFYLLSVLAAGKHASGLSTLGPKDLRKGADWALGQGWLDQPTKRWIVSARKRLLPQTVG